MPIATHLRPRTNALGLAALLCCSASATQAFDLSQLSLTFTQPTGNAAPTDNIAVFLTLSLASTSTESLIFDPRLGPTAGLPGDLVPTHGMFGNASEFAAYTAVRLLTFYGCSGTFTDETCPSSSTTYNFVWGNGLYQLAMAPGSAFTYQMGTLVPNGGRAPEGTYTFSDALLSLQFEGYDANRNPLIAYTDLASTLPLGPSFTRHVGVVPEPASAAMLLAGLGLLGLAGAVPPRRTRAR